VAKEPKESSRGSTPTRFAETTPPQVLPSGDYSYVLEIVMKMQLAIGGLVEAVDSLKDQTEEHGSELRAIAKDVHAAKVVISFVGGLIVLMGAIVAWLINTYISTYPAR